MRRFLFALPLVVHLAVHALVCQAQTPVATPVRTLDPPSAAAAAPPPAAVAYEAITLPKNRSAAWLMALTANRLEEQDMPSWYLLAHYKTYDAYGVSKGQGTLEYLWQDRNSWYVSYKEGGSTWTRWQTAKGIYGPPDQAGRLAYPESLVLDQIRDPLKGDGAPQEPPPYQADENFSAFDLTCFRTLPIVTTDTHSIAGQLRRFCFAQNRPILRYAQASYTGFYNKAVSFEHHIVAKQINLLDGRNPVLDITVDTLKTPDASQLPLLTPPSNAILLRDTTLVLPPDLAGGRVVRKVAPKYPSEMKVARVQGSVRLTVLVGVDGHAVVTDVLNSPAPALVESARTAVNQWLYTPYMKDGVPVPFETTVTITYTLGS